jgi:hypothetical protein
LREKLTGILSLDSLKQAREPRSFSLEACFSQIEDSAEYFALHHCKKRKEKAKRKTEHQEEDHL